MRFLCVTLMLVALFAAAVAVDAQGDGALMSVEQRMVNYFDNQADFAVKRFLLTCDTIQNRVYAGITVHVRDEMIAGIMAVGDDDVQRVIDKVRPDVVQAGLTVEYVVKDAASGEVLTSGIVGNEGR